MSAAPISRIKPNRARIASLARLWLACIAALLTCAEHLLTPALRRRLPLIDMPRKMLARCVAHLILICAIDRATPPKRARASEPGDMRALLRAGAQRHLTNAHGDIDIAAIARTCADPECAIADMVVALERGFTRRRPILPRSVCDVLREIAPLNAALVCDTS